MGESEAAGLGGTLQHLYDVGDDVYFFIAAEIYENGFNYAVTEGQNEELLTKKYFCVDIDISTRCMFNSKLVYTTIP